MTFRLTSYTQLAALQVGREWRERRGEGGRQAGRKGKRREEGEGRKRSRKVNLAKKYRHPGLVGVPWFRLANQVGLLGS